MSKRRYKFEVTDPEALLSHCPTALTRVPQYQKNYAVIAKLLEAAELSGTTVPGVELIKDVNEDDGGGHN